MSGEVTLTPGYLFDESSDEVLSLEKLNKMVSEMIAKLDAGSVTAREIADGSITADKLDVAIESQVSLADGSVTTAKLMDNAVTTEKILDGTILLDDLSSDIAAHELAGDSINLVASRSSPNDVTLSGSSYIDSYENSIQVRDGDVVVVTGGAQVNCNKGYYSEIILSSGSADVLNIIPDIQAGITGSGFTTLRPQTVFAATAAGTLKFKHKLRGYTTAGNIGTLSGTLWWRGLVSYRIGNKA